MSWSIQCLYCQIQNFQYGVCVYQRYWSVVWRTKGAELPFRSCASWCRGMVGALKVCKLSVLGAWGTEANHWVAVVCFVPAFTIQVSSNCREMLILKALSAIVVSFSSPPPSPSLLSRSAYIIEGFQCCPLAFSFPPSSSLLPCSLLSSLHPSLSPSPPSVPPRSLHPSSPLSLPHFFSHRRQWVAVPKVPCDDKTRVEGCGWSASQLWLERRSAAVWHATSPDHTSVPILSYYNLHTSAIQWVAMM